MCTLQEGYTSVSSGGRLLADGKKELEETAMCAAVFRVLQWACSPSASVCPLLPTTKFSTFFLGHHQRVAQFAIGMTNGAV